jgi:hypothetical protein
MDETVGSFLNEVARTQQETREKLRAHYRKEIREGRGDQLVASMPISEEFMDKLNKLFGR